ncbi:MAG: dockerin type I repeat-containing protein [Planctomycetota bacterium]
MRPKTMARLCAVVALVGGMSAVSAVLPPAEPKVLFNNWNIEGVSNHPSSATSFILGESVVITYVNTYHWNDGKGVPAPGTISLQHADGTVYGPWQATGKPGQAGNANALWEVTPNVAVKAGTYTVIDSDTATWSTNAGSSNAGFGEVRGGVGTDAVDHSDGEIQPVGPASPVPCDVNGDGKVGMDDVLLALKVSVGLLPNNPRADVDKDGQVTAADARLIRNRVLGIKE